MVNESEVPVMGDPNAPGLLLLHPWWGVTDAVQWWAEQLAGAGRRVMIPDFYGGRTADTIEDARSLRDAMDQQATTRLLDSCADQIGAGGGEWAAMGFSMGAVQACQLAGRGTAGPRELALFYGGWPPTGDDVRTKRVSIHFVCDDEFFTEEEIAETENGFLAHDVTVEGYLYQGCGHWFAERGSPGFDEAATELALSRVLAQLGR